MLARSLDELAPPVRGMYEAIHAACEAVAKARGCWPSDVLSQMKFPSVVYDSAGNLTRDAAAIQMTYDAENHLKNFNNGAGQYFYDGDGRRVKKIDNSGTTVFVYNVAGQLMAEYTTGTPAAGDTSYLTTDHLGSTRLVTDSGGNVKARYDYLPFGEQIPASVGNRSSIPGYGASDSTRQKFTQKERDSESGLDYFLARYYSSAQGRFSSPDEPFADQDEANPQSWNLYGYVRNNPLNNTDPNGRETCFYTKSGEKVACLGQKGVEVKGEQLIVRGNVYDLNRLNAATNVRAPISDIQMTPLARGVFTELDRRAAASLKLIDIAANITLTPISIISGSGLFRAGAGLTTLATGAAEASSIRIGARGLAHVLGRHAAGGARTAGKSLFNGGEGEIVSLIREAGTVAQVPQAGGNFARVVDAGRIIGVDRATGAPTSVYTVITNAAHELVTAFPGRP